MVILLERVFLLLKWNLRASAGLLGQLIHMILYEERNTDLRTSDGYLPSIFIFLVISILFLTKLHTSK